MHKHFWPVFLALSIGAAAQQPTPPTNQQQLSHTEQLALQALVSQFQQQLSLIAEDIAKSHPGYTLNPQTLKLEPIKAPAAETPKKP
jgi:hypothetical protein